MININKYTEVERELAETYGPFGLFALFLREDSAGRWDVLVSSDWIEDNKQRAMNLIAEKLKEKLDTEELISISRIVLIEDSNPALSAFQSEMNIERGNIEVKDSNLFGLPIKHAHIITSRRTNQTAARING